MSGIGLGGNGSELEGAERDLAERDLAECDLNEGLVALGKNARCVGFNHPGGVGASHH